MRRHTPSSTAGALHIGGDKAGRLLLLVYGPVERGGTSRGRLWKHRGLPESSVDKRKLQMLQLGAKIEYEPCTGRERHNGRRRVQPRRSTRTVLSAFEQRIFCYCGRGGSQGQTQEGNTVM